MRLFLWLWSADQGQLCLPWEHCSDFTAIHFTVWSIYEPGNGNLFSNYLLRWLPMEAVPVTVEQQQNLLVANTMRDVSPPSPIRSRRQQVSSIICTRSGWVALFLLIMIGGVGLAHIPRHRGNSDLPQRNTELLRNRNPSVNSHTFHRFSERLSYPDRDSARKYSSVRPLRWASTHRFLSSPRNEDLNGPRASVICTCTFANQSPMTNGSRRSDFAFPLLATTNVAFVRLSPFVLIPDDLSSHSVLRTVHDVHALASHRGWSIHSSDNYLRVQRGYAVSHRVIALLIVWFQCTFYRP